VTDLVSRVASELERPADADELLRSVIAMLTEDPRITWAGIAFVEAGQLVVGPSAGSEDQTSRARVPVLYRDDPVAELWVDGNPDLDALRRVAALISPHCLVGWDTRGEAWDTSF
jgi:hypothetical protein